MRPAVFVWERGTGVRLGESGIFDDIILRFIPLGIFGKLITSKIPPEFAHGIFGYGKISKNTTLLQKKWYI